MCTPDRIGHDLLDGVQPHNDMGIAGVLLRAGLLLQLRDRRTVRGLAHRRTHAAHLLVHGSTHGNYIFVLYEQQLDTLTITRLKV